MKPEDIKDRETLERWLKGQDRAMVVAIAHRAAMRAAPLWFAGAIPEGVLIRQLDSLRSLRQLLTSGVAVGDDGPTIIDAARSAAGEPLFGFVGEKIVIRHRSGNVPPSASAAFAVSAFGDREHRVGSDSESGAFPSAWDYAGEAANVHRSYFRDVRSYEKTRMFAEIRSDARELESNQVQINFPLWINSEPPWFTEAVQNTRAIWAEDPTVWSFWSRWWDGAVSGHPMPWDVQRDVALIPSDDWEKGAAHIAKLIAAIEAQYVVKADGQGALDRLGLAHTDFTFDTARRLMKMVPFEQDIGRLTDPETLRRLLNDSADFRSVLETLVRAAEASGRQSANELKVFAQEILAELDRVSTHEELRVGVLIDLGETLQDFAGDENTRMGLGPTLPKPLNRAVDRLLDLLRAYFGPAMARIGPLRDITLGEGDDPRAILAKAAENLRLVTSHDGQKAIPLAAEDIAVLERLLDELRRSARAYEQATLPDAKKELEQEFARKAAQFAYDTGLYVKRAVDVVQGAMGGKDNDTADALLRRIHLAHTTQEILLAVWEFVRHLL